MAPHVYNFPIHRKNATVKLTEMADSDSIGSKEKQGVDIFVDNHLLKIPNMQGSEKNIAVELVDMVSRGSTDYQWEVRVWRENRLYGGEEYWPLLSLSGSSMGGRWRMTTPLNLGRMGPCWQTHPFCHLVLREVQCLEGEQVTLMMNATSRPTPTVTWLSQPHHQPLLITSGRCSVWRESRLA